MKVTAALLLMALVATIQTSDAWRIRLPRLGLRRIIAPLCTMACTTKCTTPQICAPVCHKVCNIGRKRRAANDDEKPFSPDFTKYDLNKDGAIELTELAKAISSTEAECDELFKNADKDNDKKIDIDEFIRGPFQFEDIEREASE